MQWFPLWVLVGFVPALVGLSHCAAWTSQVAHEHRIAVCANGGGGWNLTDSKCEYPTKGETK